MGTIKCIFIAMFSVYVTSLAYTASISVEQKGKDELVAVAQFYARKILKSENITATYYDTYYNPDGTPYAYIYECESENSYTLYNIATLAISASTDKYPLLSFSRCKAPVSELVFGSTSEQKFMTTGGLFAASGNAYARIPRQMYPGDTVTILSYESSPAKSTTEQAQMARAWIKSLASTSITTCTLATTSTQKSMPGDVEVLLADVPSYMWYLSCGITTDIMLLAYWNEHGYPDLIPGGNSSTGHYWASAEEDRYFNLSEDTRVNRLNIEYYASAIEYGFNYATSTETTSMTENWDGYTTFIDSAKHPVYVGWNGEPYGAHATVGVGYAIIDSVRFIILHDTYQSTPKYVNYDEYKSSIYSCVHWYFNSTSQGSQSIDYTSTQLSSQRINLYQVPFTFSSIFLSNHEQAYHSFHLEDIDDDSSLEFVSISSKLVYENTSLDNFVGASGFWSTSQTMSLGDVEVCDVNNDSELDIITTGYGNGIYLYLSSNHTYPTTYTTIAAASVGGSGFLDIEFGDLNNDGYKDMVATSVSGSILRYKNTAGTFSLMQTYTNNKQSPKVSLSDLNNDGYLDIIASFRSQGVAIYKNVNGGFASSPVFSYTSGHGSTACTVGDINNDGYKDVVTINDGEIIIHENNIGVLSSTPVPVNNTVPCYAKDMKLADLNDDGYLDLIVANYNTPSCVFANNSGQFDSLPSWVAPNVDPAYEIATWYSVDSSRQFVSFGRSKGSILTFYEVGKRTQFIPLEAGWNLVSTNVHPADSNITTLFAGIDLQEVKNEAVFWLKGQDPVFNSLQSISAGNGYLVKMNNPGLLTLRGKGVATPPVPQHTTSSSWQLIGCPYAIKQNIASIFDTTNCSSIKNFSGFWQPSGLTNSLYLIEPGKGYFFKNR